jgi:hypothetical protein
MAPTPIQSQYDAVLIFLMEAVMGKRVRPIAIIEDPDFPEVGAIGSLELPTADEFVCSGDEVREECAMLDGTYEVQAEYASS